MSTADVPSSNLYWPDAQPVRIFARTENSTGNTVRSNLNSSVAGGILVLGVDITAIGTVPTQCFVQVQIPNGIPIYYDSQSIGEGLGVRFPWRGQAVLLPGELMAVEFSSANAVQWSVGAWGLALPFYTLNL